VRITLGRRGWEGKINESLDLAACPKGC